MDGAELPGAESSAPPQDYMRCPSCWRSFPSRASFCASDGTPLLRALPNTGKSDAKEIDRGQPLAQIPATGLQVKKTINQNLLGSEFVGTTLDDRYRIETIIAEGGMAILYRAHQIGMDRTVAIKVMLPTFAANSQAAERFAQECKLAARLNHPNIVSVYDVGFIGPRQPYLVMEYIDGISLSRELSDNGPPPLSNAITIIGQVLKGLEEAHGAGIIHRDLKPDNILLQKKSHRSDWVKIVDFGIANLADRSKRLTKTGSFIGTPAYMAPEQFRGKAIDTRVDLYSVGIVLFEVLTGDIPFDGETPDVVMMRHLIDEPPSVSQIRPSVSPQLDALLKKALAKDPADRFQTAGEFGEALESCLKTN
jgi:serine/threonine-protein kinase